MHREKVLDEIKKDFFYMEKYLYSKNLSYTPRRNGYAVRHPATPRKAIGSVYQYSNYVWVLKYDDQTAQNILALLMEKEGYTFIGAYNLLLSWKEGKKK